MDVKPRMGARPGCRLPLVQGLTVLLEKPIVYGHTI
jgi:hypothetical protein